MTNTWPEKKLREIAEIRVSNVDKKRYATEKPVQLCNYMDVYSNDYISSKINFMEASATPAEIERFRVECGDVIITKDSETPDDIGIPSVVIEEIERLVCGYHLALIKPNQDLVDPIYIAKQLSTSSVARYFALRASGSTRFGLPISAIESARIPTPPKSEQIQIAAILSTIDKAIAQTEAIIAKQQRIKTGLMQDLLTRGIDENGNIRSEETHEFKDSPLGRIPVEWGVMKVGDVFKIQLGKMLSQKATEGKNPSPYIGNKNVQWDYVDLDELLVMDFDDREQKKYELRVGDVLVCEGGDVGRTALWRGEIDDCFYQKAIHRLRPIDNIYLPQLFPRFMKFAHVNGWLDDFTSKTSIAHLTKEKLESVPIMIPMPEEQLRLCDALDRKDERLRIQVATKDKLVRTKTALMQDLLTGKVRVTELLKQQPAS
jgi:type I restriction enzyme, S subunit